MSRSPFVSPASLALLALLFWLAPSGFAKTYTVDVDGGGDFTEIQPALDAAADGDTVLVLAGEYRISESLDFNRLRESDGPIKNLVLRAQDGSRETTIRMLPRFSRAPWDPDPWDRDPELPPPVVGPASVVVFANGESARSVLQGFKITGGSGSWSSHGKGGGGILCTASSSPTLQACVISGNTVRGFDGEVVELAFGDVWALRGRIDGGDACGGGLYCDGGASPTVVNCVIADNSAIGGREGERSFWDWHRCDWDPWCQEGWEWRIETGTDGRGFGAAIAVFDGAAPSFVHCTIVGNSAGPSSSDDGGVFSEGAPTFESSIIWRNGSSDFTDIDVSHCVYEGADGNDNLDVDPLFFDQESGDYRLQPDSPCVDAGMAVDAPLTDIDGVGRPCGYGVDIGAHESGDCSSERFRRGDVNGEGIVDMSDAVSVLIFLFNGTSEPACLDAADTNDSGDVDLSDAIVTLSFLFLHYGPPPYPGPSVCGVDSTSDNLGCAAYEACDAI